MALAGRSRPGSSSPSRAAAPREPLALGLRDPAALLRRGRRGRSRSRLASRARSRSAPASGCSSRSTRADRRGDAIACALGVVALGLASDRARVRRARRRSSSSFGRERGWRTVWVVGRCRWRLYALWWLTLRDARRRRSRARSTIGDAYASPATPSSPSAPRCTGIFRCAVGRTTVDFFTTASRVIAALAVLGAVVAVARARRVSAGLARGARRARGRAGRPGPRPRRNRLRLPHPGCRSLPLPGRGPHPAGARRARRARSPARRRTRAARDRGAAAGGRRSPPLRPRRCS